MFDVMDEILLHHMKTRFTEGLIIAGENYFYAVLSHVRVEVKDIL